MSDSTLANRIYNGISGFGGMIFTNAHDAMQMVAIENSDEMSVFMQSGGDAVVPIGVTGLFNFITKNKAINPRLVPWICMGVYSAQEIVSYWHTPLGTFDPKDLAAYAIGGTIAYIGTKLTLNENPLNWKKSF